MEVYIYVEPNLIRETNTKDSIYRVTHIFADTACRCGFLYAALGNNLTKDAEIAKFGGLSWKVWRFFRGVVWKARIFCYTEITRFYCFFF